MIKEPIYQGILQSDLDFAGFNPINLTGWPPAGGGGGGGTAVQGRIVSVKDAPYNAHGDGVTDDTVAINTAIAAMVSAGGGTVFFPRGDYLVNGAFDTYWKSILVIPYINGGTTASVTLQLLGEEMPSWNAPGFATPYNHASTIRTTRTDGMTADATGFAAVIAGNQPLGNPLHSVYADFNGCMTRIKNMKFIVPSNPTMGGIRLDGIGMAFVEDVSVNTTDDNVEPMHGTTAVWMPNAINWSINWMLHVNVGGFDTGFKTGEHLRAPMIQAYNCKNGVSFLESQYPSWANIQLGNCVEGIRFLGSHTVDLILETEHAPSGWYSCLHDIKDPSNLGQGIVRYYIGHGTPTLPTIAAAVDGGTGLTLMDLCGGNVTMNTTQGASGGASLFIGKMLAANPFYVGYYDTALTRSNTSEMTATDGSTGLSTFKAGTVYVGTDARLTPISGGVKLEVRNTGTGTWVEATRYTNP